MPVAEASQGHKPRVSWNPLARDGDVRAANQGYNADRLSISLALCCQVGKLIPISSVEGPNDAHPVPVSDEPEAGVKVRRKVGAGHQPLDACKKGPMVEHHVLLAIKSLMKVDTLHVLRHVALFDSVRKGTDVVKPDFPWSKRTVARPQQHVVSFDPRHVAAHIGPVDLALLPAEWAWLWIVPMEGGDLLRWIVRYKVHLQAAEGFELQFSAKLGIDGEPSKPNTNQMQTMSKLYANRVANKANKMQVKYKLHANFKQTNHTTHPIPGKYSASSSRHIVVVSFCHSVVKNIADVRISAVRVLGAVCRLA